MQGQKYLKKKKQFLKTLLIGLQQKPIQFDSKVRNNVLPEI
jgi:hypothetical protein